MTHLVRAVILCALLAASCGGSAATPPTASPTIAAPALTAAPVGAITGGLGFPSNFIPSLTVYAVSVADKRVFFSVDTPRYGGDPNPSVPSATILPGTRPSFTITGVLPGTYNVFAYRNDNDPNNYGGPGLHSQYLLKCVPPTATAICTDHSLLPVLVTSGQTVSGIDVMDWYYDAQKTTYPPRP